MARIEQFDLAFGPVRQTSALAVRGAGVAFTSTVPNPVVGIFRPRTSRVTEFELPFTPGVSNFWPQGLLWRGNRVIVATANGPLVDFHPASGRAVYIEGVSRNPWLASHNVAMDSKRDIWTSCFYRHGLQAGLVPGLARISIGRNRVRGRFWQLPDELLQPHDLWVDHMDRVWFSLFAGGSTSPSPFYSIGRLDPANGELKGWKVMDGLDPVFLGIAGMPGAPEIWFTRNAPSGLYRLDIATDRVEAFSHPMVNGLQDIVVDGNGDPWFSADDGFVSTLSRHLTGMTVNTRHRVWPVEGHDEDLVRTPVTATRRPTYVAAALGTNELEQTFGPFLRWQPPGLTAARPKGLFLQGDRIWFADSARNRLGVLQA